MRSILVMADHGSGMAARLDTALALARAHDGHVTLVVDTPVDRYVTTDPFGGTFIAQQALDEALEADDALAISLKERLSRDDVPFDIVQLEQTPVEALGAAARLADLVIVSRRAGYAGDLALAVRCPVLALGDHSPLAVPVARACIAWDGSDEAALALRSATPLLAGRDDVCVLSVVGQTKGFPATDALRYLSRHGIKAELRELLRERTVEETLTTALAEIGAGLLVMGAYSHSRIREMLFGGVTRYFLEEPSAPPLLLAH